MEMEEVHRARYLGRGMKRPCSVWVPLSQHQNLSTNPEALWNLCFWDIMEAPSQRQDQSWTSFSALLPSQEKGEQSWKFQTSNHGLVFLETSSHPEAHPESPHQNKRYSYHPGNYKDFRSSMPGTAGRDKYTFSIISQTYYPGIHRIFPNVVQLTDSLKRIRFNH